MKDTQGDRPTQPAACPRCGYDQRGQVSTWTDRCPMQGTCTECGLDLDWPRVFRLSLHPWLFEYHWRDRPLQRLILTISRAMTPRRFWREVRLDDPVHLRPVWVIAIALLFLFVIAYVVMATTVVHTTMGIFIQRHTSTTSDYWVRVAQIVYRDWIAELPVALIAPLVMMVMMPLTFAMIPVTLRRARVRAGHVCRIALYGLILPCAVAVAWVFVQFALHMADLESVANWINPWMWAGWRPTAMHMYLWYFVIASGIAALLACWLAYWWAVAAKQYLRLPTPMTIAAVMAFASLLAGVTLHLWIVVLL